MNLYIQRNMIVPAEFAPLARALAAHLAGPPAEGMWLTGLSPDGTEPASTIRELFSSGEQGLEDVDTLRSLGGTCR